MLEFVKGWPSEGALDEMFAQATGQDLAVGDVVVISAGKATAATYDNAGVNAALQPGIVVGVCPVTAKVTVLLSSCIVEIDADNYVTGTYANGDNVTATGGKFDVIDTDTRVIGKILAFNGTTGIMRVLFTSTVA